MEDFVVSVAQYEIALGDKEKNINKAEKMAKKASSEGADFLVLPEYMSTGSLPSEGMDHAEAIPGETSELLCEISGRYGIHIVGSILERSDDRIYNTALLTDKEGELLASYRKIHLFMDEQKHIINGNSIITVDTEFGKVGLMICYDSIFPEVARKIALSGAKMIFVPANWPDPFDHQWQLSTSARALDNQVWLAASNRVGSDEKFTYFGKSRIVNPLGITVEECGGEEEIIFAQVNDGLEKEFKDTVDFIGDMQDI